MHDRNGVSTAEVVIGMSLFVLVLAAVQELGSMSTRSSERASSTSGALRSTLVGVEMLRYDLGRVLIQDEASDIKVEDEGRKIVLVISGEPDPDLNKFTPQRVSYYLRATGSDKQCFRLIREGPEGARVAEGCYLQRLHIRYVQNGDSLFSRPHVEVTVVGVDAPGSKESYIASIVVPVKITEEPRPYELVKAGVL